MSKGTQVTSKYIVYKIATISWESKTNMDSMYAKVCRLQNSKRPYLG